MARPTLDVGDAAEFAEVLQFLGGWLGADPGLRGSCSARRRQAIAIDAGIGRRVCSREIAEERKFLLHLDGSEHERRIGHSCWPAWP